MKNDKNARHKQLQIFSEGLDMEGNLHPILLAAY